MSASGRKELNAVSLFSGGGGLDLGIEAAGFETLYATDIDKSSCETLRKGKLEAKKRKKPFLKKAVIYEGDICALTSQSILEAIPSNKDIHLLVGGPPCQPFSVSGKRRGSSDPNGKLIFEYLRLLEELNPQVFLFENVQGLVTTENGAVYNQFICKLETLSRKQGYKFKSFRLNAVDFGIPQQRDRIFFIGYKGDELALEIPPIVSNSKDGLPQYRTVEDAFRRLPNINSDFPKNHIGRSHGPIVTERYRTLLNGARDEKTRINKLDLKRPSFTIVVGSDKGGGKGHIHPTEPREVTPRESARIQTFPDWWGFCGSAKVDAIRQIGNAVPPLMGAMIANSIRSQIFGLDSIKLKRILELLGQTHLFENEINNKDFGL